MKPLQNQYQDLLEGKMSKFNFLTNIKRTLPDLVSNITSLEDAVKILKNKRILSEEQSSVNETIASRLKPNTKYEYTGGAETEELEYIGKSSDHPEIKIGSSMGKGHIFKWPDGKYFELGLLSVMKYIKKIDNGEDEEIVKRYEREQEKHALPGGHLRESVEMPANLVADIDKVNPLEYRTGLDYELDLSGDFSAESLVKCAKKVVKNLKKDPIYYTDLKAELTQKINNKKVKSSNYEEVKKDNQVDKLNQLKSIVKKEIANTKTSLSKQEKASKAMPKGVKLMKEEKENAPKLSADIIQDIIQKAGGPRSNLFHIENSNDGTVYVISKNQGMYRLVGDAKNTIEKYFDIEEEHERLDDRDRYEYFIKTNPNKPKSAENAKSTDKESTDDIFENSEKERQEKDFSKFSDKMIGKKPTAVNTIKDKIKTYVTNQLKKEAVKFTIGSEKEYVSDAESRGFEDKLRKAGVTKFTKSKVQ